MLGLSAVAINTLVPCMNAGCFNGMNVGAADRVDPVSRPVSTPRTNTDKTEVKNFTCRNLSFADNSVVLLCTSAVRVINPHVGGRNSGL